MSNQVHVGRRQTIDTEILFLKPLEPNLSAFSTSLFMPIVCNSLTVSLNILEISKMHTKLTLTLTHPSNYIDHPRL